MQVDAELARLQPRAPVLGNLDAKKKALTRLKVHGLATTVAVAPLLRDFCSTTPPSLTQVTVRDVIMRRGSVQCVSYAKLSYSLLHALCLAAAAQFAGAGTASLQRPWLVTADDVQHWAVACISPLLGMVLQRLRDAWTRALRLRRGCGARKAQNNTASARAGTRRASARGVQAARPQ